MARHTPARVNKRSAPATARTRSKMSSASSSGGARSLAKMVLEAAGKARQDDAGTDALDSNMIEESDGWVLLPDANMDTADQPTGNDKGKGKLVEPALKRVEDTVEDNPFRLFDLPTEIRLEIYRACLTRPYKILLSKTEKPPTKAEEKEDRDTTPMLLDNGESATVQSPSTKPTTTEARPPSSATGSRSSSRSTQRASSSNSPTAQTNASHVQHTNSNATPAPTLASGSSDPTHSSVASKSLSRDKGRTQLQDPLIVAILRANKDVYKEARDVLYSENVFQINIFTAVNSLAALHQRSRRRIKHVELEIPVYTEILESFSETVRLSLRYCSGLRKLVIHTPFLLPGGEGAASAGNTTAGASTGGNTTVYANGFDILRWLPQGCEIVLEGTKNVEIETVVDRHRRLAGIQDKTDWHARMYISPYDQGGFSDMPAKRDTEGKALIIDGEAGRV